MLNKDTELLMKVASLPEDRLEKLAVELGMTKEALKAELLRGLMQAGRAITGKGRLVTLPAAAGQTAGALGRMTSQRAALARELGASPRGFRAGPPQPMPIGVRTMHRGQVIPQPSEILGTRGVVTPRPRGSIPVPRPRQIPGTEMSEAAAPWTTGRKLKWGLGLGGAGLLGYQGLRPEQPQEPLQYYGSPYQQEVPMGWQ